MSEISTSMIIVISIFSFLYLIYLFRKSARYQINLFETLLLSNVAFIPLLFVYFPEISLKISDTIGLSLPFVLCFGILFVVLFIMIIRLSLKIYDLENSYRALIQEAAIFKLKKKDEE